MKTRLLSAKIIVNEEDTKEIIFNRKSREIFVDSYNHLYSLTALLEDIMQFLKNGWNWKYETVHSLEAEDSIDIIVEFSAGENIVKHITSYKNRELIQECVYLDNELAYSTDNKNFIFYFGSAYDKYNTIFNNPFSETVYFYFLNPDDKPITKPYVSIKGLCLINGFVLELDLFIRDFYDSLIVFNEFEFCGYDKKVCQEIKVWEFVEKLLPQLDLGVDEVKIYRETGYSGPSVSFSFKNKGHSFSSNQLGSGLNRIKTWLPLIVYSVIKDITVISNTDLTTGLHPVLAKELLGIFRKYNTGQLIMPWNNYSHENKTMNEYYQVGDKEIAILHSEKPDCLIIE